MPLGVNEITHALTAYHSYFRKLHNYIPLEPIKQIVVLPDPSQHSERIKGAAKQDVAVHMLKHDRTLFTMFYACSNGKKAWHQLTAHA